MNIFYIPIFLFKKNIVHHKLKFQIYDNFNISNRHPNIFTVICLIHLNTSLEVDKVSAFTTQELNKNLLIIFEVLP
jgi:hypothetical protein